MHRYQSALLRTAVALALGLASLDAAQAESCKGATPASFKLNGDVKHKATYALADLQNFKLDPATPYTPTVLTVSFNTSTGPVTATYTGIPLMDLITVADPKLNPKQKNDILRKYVIAHASDCYEAVVALGEVLPRFENKQVLVAYADGDGNPLPDSEGMAHLIVPGDAAGGRSVFHLSRLTVRTAPKK
jgi:DMSO/TMAO reductase YedYZ molybdopterin-dependent catalytic subunit